VHGHKLTTGECVRSAGQDLNSMSLE